MTFKEKIVKLRKLRGLTQDELASAVGVSRQAVYKWESGQSYPEATKLLEIKLLFGISIDDLLDDSYEVVIPDKKKRKTNSEIKMDSEKSTAEPKAKKDVAEAFPAQDPVIMEMAEEPLLPEAEEREESEGSDKTERAKKKGFFERIFGKK